MKRAIGSVVLLLACCTSSQRVEQLREFTPVAQEFVRAAGAQDSANLAQLAADTLAFRRGKDLWRLEPNVANAATDQLSPRKGWIRADTALVEFKVDVNGKAEDLQFSFVRREGRWVVRYLTLANDQ